MRLPKNIPQQDMMDLLEGKLLPIISTNTQTLVMQDVILKSLKDGRPEAMLTFYQNLKPPMYECVIGFVKNHEDAEDIVSETIIEFIDKKKYLEINGNLLAYLMISCRNRSRNFMRTTKRRIILDKDYHNNLHAQAQLYISKYQDTEEERRKEQVELIYRAIEKLPKKRRMIMKMRYLQEKKPKVIAQEMNEKAWSVKKHLNLGVTSIKDMFRVKKTK